MTQYFLLTTVPCQQKMLARIKIKSVEWSCFLFPHFMKTPETGETPDIPVLEISGTPTDVELQEGIEAVRQAVDVDAIEGEG